MAMKRTDRAVASSGRVSPTAPESKSLSGAVWGYLESIPGFNEDLRQAEADLAAGRGVPFEPTRRRARRSQSEG
jgi:hypothetical protein